MKENTINHNALVHLVDAGAISSATVSANGDIWSLKVISGDKSKTVMAKNSGKPRVWRKLDTLAKYLQSLGLSKFEIDITGYDPEQKSLTRPDSSASLKRTHKAHKSKHVEALTRPKKHFTTAESPEKIREKWEERRARILAEENPRVE